MMVSKHAMMMELKHARKKASLHARMKVSQHLIMMMRDFSPAVAERSMMVKLNLDLDCSMMEQIHNLVRESR